MDFGVLGPLEVRRDTAPVAIGSRMQRRLVALLLVQGGAPVSADRVIDVLWHGDPPPSAAKGLHTYVSRLRRSLGDGDHVTSDEHGYRVVLEGHDLDVRRFESLVATARERLDDAPKEAADLLAEALSLWRGPAYGEFADEAFARSEAVRLDEMRLAATEDAFSARAACGDAGLIPDLEAFASEHPLRERPHAQLMRAFALVGRQHEALEVFQRVRRKLADEFGLDPSPTLSQVQADILRHAPTVTARGRTRADSPVSDRVPGELPQPVTSFIGRTHETAAVRRLVARGPLVTLTGFGGVGKTRLALQAASAVRGDHPDGTWWCGLAPVDPGSVGHAVATALGVQQQANRGITASIVGALAGKRALLVLDNCEHVVVPCARLVGDILAGCPDVTILATSREPLAVDGEQVWHVPPLLLPSDRPSDAATAPSSQLFLDRARSHRADFEPDAGEAAAIDDICRQLDGLPLAIELAAALVPALEPVQIARRLGHRFGLLTRGSRTEPRHRSLAAVVEWSYQLLDSAEQQLFDRLAVFAGGFSLSAAEGVCADDQLPPEGIAGLVAALVSRSMIGVDRGVHPTRYHLLETLRQYAGRRLAERGEESVFQARHASWFVHLAERTDADVRGPAEADGVALLEAEFANLRAAHRWAVDHDDADLALRLSAALYVFAIYRLQDEVFVWAEQSAGMATADGHELRPTVWGVVAHGISNRGELTRTRELAERALADAAEADHVDRSAAWHALSATALYEGELAECRRHTARALAAARRRGDAYYLAMEPIHEVLALVYGGDRAEAVEAALAHRAAADALGNPNQQAWARYGHAEACGDEEPAMALALLDEALALAGPVHGRYLEGVARVAMVSLRARHRSPHEAVAAFPELIGHWRRAGDWVHQWTTLRNLVPLLVRVGADEPAALLYAAQRVADTGAPAFGADAERLADACRTLEARLGEDRLRTLIQRGAQLTGDAATDLALTAVHAVGSDGSDRP